MPTPLKDLTCACGEVVERGRMLAHFASKHRGAKDTNFRFVKRQTNRDEKV